MATDVKRLFAKFRAPGLLQDLRDFFQPRELECLQVEVTSCCMGRCVYCPHTTRSDAWKSRHMSPEIFAALWPVMTRAGRVHLQGWGEPFLNPHFMDFVSLARRAGCAVSTTTCGMVMNEKLAEDIVARRYIDWPLNFLRKKTLIRPYYIFLFFRYFLMPD